jgi:peptide subunit release factor 1 (eRF1)
MLGQDTGRSAHGDRQDAAWRATAAGYPSSMEMSTTGYVANERLIAEDLRRLAALRPGAPVLSLYLDLDPSDLGTQRAHRSAYTSLLDEAHKRVEAYETDHAGKVSLRADVERAGAFFDGYRPKRGRGVVVFAASAAQLFEAYTLPRPPRRRVVVGDSPYVVPLASLADTRDWLVVLLDARHARFLHGSADHLAELERIEDSVAGQHEGQGTSDHQRWVEHHVDAHLKRAAAEVDRQLETGRFDRVLVGGPPEMVPRFEEHHLSNPARERLAGRFDVEVPDTIPDDVRRAAIQCFEEDERRRERDALDRLGARLGRGERAAAGSADVLAMLEQARVETLLYDERGGAPGADVLERAIEAAVAQSAEVLPLRHHDGALEQHENIAALLRF